MKQNNTLRERSPLVSVVVLSMNKTRDILSCIGSVKRQSYRNFNIIVVDNGSTEGTPEVIANIHPDIHIIRNAENLGICTGRNQGYLYARKHFSSDYILQLDNDTLLDPEYLAQLLDAAAGDPAVGLACGKAYGAYPSAILASAGISVNSWTGVIKDRGLGQADRGQFDSRQYVDAAPGFGNLIRAEVLSAVDGWNTAYDPYGWDDADLCLRIRRKDFRILYVPEAVIYHSGTQSGRPPVPEYERSKTKNYFRFIRDHLSVLQRICVYALLPFRFAGLMVRHLRHGHGRMMSSYTAGLLALIDGRGRKGEARTPVARTRVCVLSSQVLGAVKIGGFGSMTRMLARALVSEGYDVVVAVLRRAGERTEEVQEGYHIVRLSRTQIFCPRTYRKINADIYHSQNQSLMTLMAEFSQPHAGHIVTCRDPRDFRDWLKELRYAAWRRKFRIPLDYLFEEGPLGRHAVRKADIVGCPAYFLRGKVMKLYGLPRKPVFLPNIEHVPRHIPQKSAKPSVLFIGRFVGVKRPELFIRLAAHFPGVRFVMVGKDDDERHQGQLERLANEYPNVTMVGFLDKFNSPEFTKALDEAWILVNTSAKESLPVSFVEAAGRGCAILSRVDPDGFASRFGYVVKDDDFTGGLRYLLEDERYRVLGEKGHEYVRGRYRYEYAVREHIRWYERLLANAGHAGA